MTDQELEARIELLVHKERRIVQEILELMREAESRMLYARRGYSSMYEWLNKRFGYSQSAAHRMVQAARLYSQIPEVKEKLKMGDLNLTNIAQLQGAVRREEIRLGEKISIEAKKQLITQIENKSSEETAKILLRHFPVSGARRESLKAVTLDYSKLTVVLEEPDKLALERVRALLSHSCQSWSAVISWLANDYLKRRDPARKK